MLHMFPALPSPSHLRLIATGLALAALALSSACNGGDNGSEDGPTPDIVVSFPSPSGDVTPRPRTTPVPSVTPTPTPLKVCSPNPDPAQANLLQVQEPRAEQQVKVPFHVSGWGANIGFENRGVAVGIVNAKQEVVQVLNLPPQPRTYRVAPPGLDVTDYARPFGADIVLENIKEPTPICIWVYLETADDGTPRGVVQVPVVVVP